MKSALICGLILISCFKGVSQSCPNIGFEDSSFVNWTGYTGSYNDLIGNMTVGIDPTRHKIISAYPVMPYDSLCDTLLAKVAPGSDFSVRLGNSNVGARHEKLLYTLQVDSSNFLFTYASAIVLQDPGHSITSQPYFQITLLDTAGNELDSVCGKIEIFADPSIPGFIQSQSSGGFQPPLYRDWTFGGIDLTAYEGQSVTVEFTTKDCNAGGHYGYAYIDAGCYPKEIVTQFCEGSTDSIRMSAPIGFEYLWNTGDTGQTLSVLPEIADSAYFVTCTSSLTGCSFELSTTTEPTFYYDFGVKETSCGEAQIQTTLKISRGSIANFYWDFGDTTTLGDTSNLMTPTYTYPGPGVYVVTLIADDGLGCRSDTLTDSVNIYFPPQADFIADTACLDYATIFNNLSEISPNVFNSFNWTFGDGSTDTAYTPIHEFDQDTIFLVTLSIWSDSSFCGDTITKPILIRPRPTASFYNFEPDSCIPHEVHFINESSYKDSSTIVSYAWNFGNDDLDSIAIPTYVYLQPGIFSPSLILTDTFGCQDSIKYENLIRVANIPTADFTASPLEVHISDAAVYFTNKSNDADRFIWTFGNENNLGVGTSEDDNPNWIFPRAGNYEVQLLALSDLGCFDTASLNIRVIDDRLFISNVITPNGDGVNDAFNFIGDHSSMTNFKCAIYNRWGTLIFDTNNPGFNWDGSLHGEIVSPGTYFYTIEYDGFNNESFSFKGELSVLP